MTLSFTAVPEGILTAYFTCFPQYPHADLQIISLCLSAFFFFSCISPALTFTLGTYSFHFCVRRPSSHWIELVLKIVLIFNGHFNTNHFLKKNLTNSSSNFYITFRLDFSCGMFYREEQSISLGDTTTPMLTCGLNLGDIFTLTLINCSKLCFHGYRNSSSLK